MYNNCGVYTPPQSTGGGGSGTGFTSVVANYSALPDPTTVPGEFYYCENSQGTAWLWGSIGGTYYPAGTYYSTGISWITTLTAYNATLDTVNAGIVTDQFVSPYTFANASKWNDYQLLSGKNAASGYVGLGAAYEIINTNALGTVQSTLVNAATVSRVWTLPNATGTIALTSDIPSLAGYVPYTGATTNVDLGAFNLTTPKIIGGTTPTTKIEYVAGTNATQTATAIGHQFFIGASGTTIGMTMLHNGNGGWGSSYTETVNGVSISGQRQFKVTNTGGLSRLTAEGTSHGLLDLVATSSSANNRRYGMYTNGGELYLQGFDDAGAVNKYILRVDTSGNIAMGNVAPSAKLQLLSTTEQLRSGFSSSVYWNATTSSTTVTTFDTSSGGRFVFGKGVAFPYVAKTA
jgi:hypothetical protein